MRLALLLLFFTGLFMIFANQLVSGRPAEVRYVYLPRSLDQYLREEPYATTTFKQLFDGANVDSTQYSDLT